MDQYIGRTLTGTQFNKIFKNYTFVKLTNQIEIHNKFKFKDGLNVDTIPFNPKGSCQPGGLYFTEINKMCLWLQYNCKYMYYCRVVTIPNDARVYIEKDKLKADKFILDKRTPIYGLTLWENEEMCLAAVKHNGYALGFVRNKTLKICLVAVKQNRLALKYVKKKINKKIILYLLC